MTYQNETISDELYRGILGKHMDRLYKNITENYKEDDGSLKVNNYQLCLDIYGHINHIHFDGHFKVSEFEQMIKEFKKIYFDDEGD